ncbi:MAG TPA: manganese efflux pump [Bacillota bacterium]|nr:manganese efflux pump [Bacillota bacterium]
MHGAYIIDHYTPIMMAFAVGLDAFSVSLGIGMARLRLRQIFYIGCLFGLPHIIFPLLGLLLGQKLSSEIGHFALIIGSLLLITIGLQMIFSSFNYETKQVSMPTISRLLMLALTVSLDSFPIGLSLGLSGAKIFMTLMFFGLSSTLLTCLGLLIGRKVHYFLGVYSEMLGGSVLCAFGLYMLFGP